MPKTRSFPHRGVAERLRIVTVGAHYWLLLLLFAVVVVVLVVGVVILLVVVVFFSWVFVLCSSL